MWTRMQRSPLLPHESHCFGLWSTVRSHTHDEMLWPEWVGGKLIIGTRKVGVNIISLWNRRHSTRPFCVFAMIDPRTIPKSLLSSIMNTSVIQAAARSQVHIKWDHRYWSQVWHFWCGRRSLWSIQEGWHSILRSNLPSWWDNHHSRQSHRCSNWIDHRVKEMHPNKNTTAKQETLAEARQIRVVFHAMQCGKQLSSEDNRRDCWRV